MKHYLQVTDRQFSEAAGVAQGLAPAQVIGNQGISENSPTLKNKAFPVIDHHDPSQEMPLVGDEGLELLPFSTGSRAICVERDAESDAYLHENVVVEQFKLLQPLFSTDLKQALISELVGSLVER